jgi:hypothetical protein
MSQFACPHDPLGSFLHDRDAGRFRAGVNLQAMAVDDRLVSCPVLQFDGERVGSVDDRPTGLEQLSGPCRMAGIERLTVT